MEEVKKTLKDKSCLYCPICERDIVASNKEDVDSGMSDSYVFVHDDIPHSDLDIDGFSAGIQ